ncbi:MAG: TlyA family RNA methyltransferase [Victivallales bacterium]|nr:TlyA family RNA methyltransferase [Victivallales bacterium]
MKVRADELLARQGLCPSRSAARLAIESGKALLADGSPVRKPSQMLEESQALQLADGPRYVSRGAEKLLAALDAFHPPVKGRVCLDLGASTGGFTDVLLSYGAARVYAVDVGTGQLHPKLRADPRVVSLEQTNARNLNRSLIPEPIGVLTGDLSFISVTKVLPACAPLLAENFTAIILVKPQFEAGRSDIGSGGVVRDPGVRERCVAKVVACGEELGWRPLGALPSPILGPNGNQEYLAVFGSQSDSEQGSQRKQFAEFLAAADGVSCGSSNMHSANHAPQAGKHDRQKQQDGAAGQRKPQSPADGQKQNPQEYPRPGT